MIRDAVVLALLVVLPFIVPEYREVVLWFCAGWVVLWFAGWMSFGLTCGSLPKLAEWRSVSYDPKGVQRWPMPK